MALIKCPECGSDVSSMAEMCPHCGHPIVAEEKAKKQSAYVNMIPSIIGFLLIIVGPLLTYSRQKMSILGTEEINNFNMLKMLTLESGALRTGESASMFKIIPTIIIILGVVGIVITLVKGMDIAKVPTIIAVLIPVLAFVLLICFDAIGLKSYYETQKYLKDEAIKIGLDKEFYIVSRGVGFYLTVIGTILSAVISILNAIRSKQTA